MQVVLPVPNYCLFDAVILETSAYIWWYANRRSIAFVNMTSLWLHKKFSMYFMLRICLLKTKIYQLMYFSIVNILHTFSSV